MEKSEQFSQLLHIALDALESEAFDKCSTLIEFVQHCRKFRFNETIEDYPDWLDALHRRAQAVTPSPEAPQLADAAVSLARVIGNLSYGATEAYHVRTIQEIVVNLDAG